MKNILLIGLLALSLIACKGNRKTQHEADRDAVVPVLEHSTVGETHNSQNSLDYMGTYKGVLPCADCEGISTVITLGDGTYTLKTAYLGKGDGRERIQKGRYTWDDSGRFIKLEGIENGPAIYQVGENKLIQMDMKGQKITGELADKYVLIKE